MYNWVNILTFMTLISLSTCLKEIPEPDEALCAHQLNALFNGVSNEETWAVIMYDAWGTQPSGLYSGNVVNFGNFEQCYNFKHNHIHLGQIQGQNCLVPLEVKNTTTISVPRYRISACIPATCDPANVRHLLQPYFGRINLHIPEYDSTYTCEKKSTNNTYTPLFWVALSFFIICIAITVITTIYEAIALTRNTKVNMSLASFAIYSNVCRLFNCTPPVNKEKQLLPTDTTSTTLLQQQTTFTNLNCLNGVRVLSTLAIIYQHTYYMQMSFPLINENYKFQWAQQVFSMTYISSRVTVDIFLLVSGTLIAWNFFNQRQKGKPLNIIRSYIMRYIRLTTALLPIILFTIGIMHYVGNGPNWTARTEQIIGFCDKYWWTALLHVQNYVNPYEICVGQSWYLSVDFQLYIISPLILIPLWKYGNKFLWVIFTLITSILLYIFLICMYKEIYISWFLRDTPDLYKYLYSGTQTRAMPWLIGIVLGYLLFKTQNRYIRIPKITQMFIWIGTCISMLAITFCTASLNTSTPSETKLETAFYQTFGSFFWTLCTAWIIFACCHSHGGFINHFLSHPFWLPISQLSFCIYLVHLPFQYVMIASTKTSGSFDDIHILNAFCGDIGFAFLIGLIWYLMFENPYSILAKRHLRSS